MGKANPVKANGDDAQRLVARYRRPLMSFFLRRVDGREAAEDLTQEVFLRIVRRDEPVPSDNPETFIFRIAANLLRDRARRSLTHRVADHDSLDEGGAPPGGVGPIARDLVEDRGPERVLLSQESLTEVLRALDELGGRTRDIYLLCRVDRMKQRDIAALYGMSVSAVEKHIAKAGLHLAERFGRL